MSNDEHDDPSDEPVDREHPLLCLLNLPLFDDVFLAMQARNLAMVDLHIRELECGLARAMYQGERTSDALPEMMLVGALSQMWVFATYELLRTWRQRARELIKFSGELAGTKTDEKRARLIERRRAGRRKLEVGDIAGVYAEHAWENVARDYASTGRSLALASQELEAVFEPLEALRISLAKHEVVKGGPAFAPGYSRFTPEGVAYWSFHDAQGDRCMITRWQIAEIVAIASYRGSRPINED